MLFSYIQLTTEYRGVPDSLEKVLIPIMFILYFAALIIVLANFIYRAFKKDHIVDLAHFVLRD